MTRDEAQRILLAWRPHSSDERDPDVAQALELAERDPELKAWLAEHRVFQETMRRCFRDVPVPEGLADRIIAGRKIVAKVHWSRRPAVWAAAAVILVLLGLAILWQRPTREDSFATFRSRMVGKVLRQYTMDIVTNDMTVIQRHLKAAAAPADFNLPGALSRLPALGAGVLSWKDQRVSMICLDSGTNGTLFLFVVDQAVLSPPSGEAHKFQQTNRLMTVSWSEAGKTYLLAGQGGEADLRKFW